MSTGYDAVVVETVREGMLYSLLLPSNGPYDVPPAQQVRHQHLDDGVDELLAHHDDGQLDGQLEQAAARRTLGHVGYHVYRISRKGPIALIIVNNVYYETNPEIVTLCSYPCL